MKFCYLRFWIEINIHANTQFIQIQCKYTNYKSTITPNLKINEPKLTSGMWIVEAVKQTNKQVTFCLFDANFGFVNFGQARSLILGE